MFDGEVIYKEKLLPYFFRTYILVVIVIIMLFIIILCDIIFIAVLFLSPPIEFFSSYRKFKLASRSIL